MQIYATYETILQLYATILQQFRMKLYANMQLYATMQHGTYATLCNFMKHATLCNNATYATMKLYGIICNLCYYMQLYDK
jgi:hypothetical protein